MRHAILATLLFVLGMLPSCAHAGPTGYGYASYSNRPVTGMMTPTGAIANQQRYQRHVGHELLGWCPSDHTAVWLSGTYGECSVDDKLWLSAPKNPPKGNVSRFRYFNPGDAQSGIKPPQRSWREKKSGKRSWRYKTIDGYEAWIKGTDGPNISISANIGVGQPAGTYNPGYGGMRRVQ